MIQLLLNCILLVQSWLLKHHIIPIKNSNSYQSNQNDDTCLISLVNFWAVHSVNGLVEAAAASEHREEQDEQSVACRTERQRMVLQVILPAKENRQEDEEEEEEEEANLA